MLSPKTAASPIVPDPAGGAYDAPPDPLVGWGGGYPLPIFLPPRRFRRLDPWRLWRLGFDARYVPP